MTDTKPVRRRRAQRGSGDQLRAEIVAATKELLFARGNADDVSIRAVADAVGVTPPSIYLHFSDKDDLITAVVVDVFGDLDRAMVAAGSHAETPLAKLKAFGLAYVEWAVKHPEHYRIATMDPCLRPDVDTVLSDSAFTHFSEVVVECIAAGIFVGEPLPITVALWSAAHGMASLMIAKPFLPWDQLPDLVEHTLCAAAMGHATAGIIGYDATPDEVTAWTASHHPERG
jgi:AcrR family transcriptional regulator